MKRALLFLLAGTGLAACSRGVAIESEPGPVYTIEVENPMSHPMDIWYDDGVETRELGRVESRSSREFIIASPDRPEVEIVARDAGRTHTVTRSVNLASGGPIEVVLTP